MKWFLLFVKIFFCFNVFTQIDTIEICDNHYLINLEKDSIYIRKLPSHIDTSITNELLFEKYFRLYIELDSSEAKYRSLTPNENSSVLLRGYSFGLMGPFVSESNYRDSLLIKINDGYRYGSHHRNFCPVCFDVLDEFTIQIPKNIEIILIPFVCKIIDNENNIQGSEIELDNLYGKNVQKILFIDLRNRSEMKCSVLQDLHISPKGISPDEIDTNKNKKKKRSKKKKRGDSG